MSNIRRIFHLLGETGFAALVCYVTYLVMSGYVTEPSYDNSSFSYRTQAGTLLMLIILCLASIHVVWKRLKSFLR